MLKKIDLKYHELGTGYFDQMQQEKMTLDIFSKEMWNRLSLSLRPQIASSCGQGLSKMWPLITSL